MHGELRGSHLAAYCCSPFHSYICSCLNCKTSFSAQAVVFTNFNADITNPKQIFQKKLELNPVFQVKYYIRTCGLYHRKQLVLEFKWKKRDNNHSDLISRPNICNLLMWKTRRLSTSIVASWDSMSDKQVSQKFVFNHFNFLRSYYKSNRELTKMQKRHKNLDKKIKGWILTTSFVLLRSNMINVYSFGYHRIGTTGNYRPFPYSLAYCHTTSFK